MRLKNFYITTKKIIILFIFACSSKSFSFYVAVVVNEKELYKFQNSKDCRRSDFKVSISFLNLIPKGDVQFEFKNLFGN